MIDPELRACLLWHFGTTDPRVLHELQECGDITYEEMLRRMAIVDAHAPQPIDGE